MILVAILSSAVTIMLCTTLPLITSYSSISTSSSSWARRLRHIIPYAFTHSPSTSTSILSSTSAASAPLRAASSKATCDYALVYNKPPKSGSSFIQTVITNWSEEQGRNNYKCSQRPVQTNLLLEECIPETPDYCGILNCHVFLNSHTKKLLEYRLPGHRLLTSTRYPAHRIVSFFLHLNHLKYSDFDDGNFTTLLHYLSEYNPWRLYNYHTGQDRMGKCPLDYGEKIVIASLAQQYHIVIDVNLRNASNDILKHHGLFQLPKLNEGEQRNKDRGAYKLKLPPNVRDAVYQVSCVERTLHAALQVRMASLYERATGEQCIYGNTNCIQDMEKEALKSNWMS